MQKLRERIMVGLMAATVGAVGFAGSASAAVTKVYGAGASLPAPYNRTAMDCYGQQTELIFTGPVVQTLPYFYYAGTPDFDCDPANPNGAAAAGPVNPNARVVYMSTGSGIGIRSVYSHSGTYAGDSDPAPGVQELPTIHYGNSETALNEFDVGLWDNGGGTFTGMTCNTASTGAVGLCVAAPGQPAFGNGIVNPRERYGKLVQIPGLIAVIAISYDPVYKRVRNGAGEVEEMTFRVKNSFVRPDGSGGLRLDADTYCKIFNGVITNWNDPAITALNGGQLLRDTDDPEPAETWSVPIVMVGRSESSGTTSLWTRHLAAVCESVGGNQYADSTSTLPAGLRDGNAVYNKTTDTVTGTITAGEYVTANGNDGVAQYVDFRDSHQPGANPGDEVEWGRVGYNGADFVLPYAANNGSNEFGLNTATLQNASGRFVAPSPEAAALSFGSTAPPEGADRADPWKWVEPASKTSAHANPSAPKGYPIMGTSNVLAYTCYASSKTLKALAGKNGYLAFYYNNNVVVDAANGVLALSGFSALPKAWRKAINDTFLTDKSGLGLTISVVGDGACTNGETGA
jgi:ABC-type phosphate transport system substrate-binding protein